MRRFVALAIAPIILLASGTAAHAAKPKTKFVEKPAMKHVALPAIKANSPLDKRVKQLDAVIRAQLAPDQYFAPAFLAQISSIQVVSIFDSFIAQHGRPVGLVSATPRGKYGATVKYAFERSVATIEIDIMDGGDNPVIGMQITNFSTPDDTMDRIARDIQALPGRTGFMVAQLDDKGNARILGAQRSDEQFAIGSTFKLYILSELAHQIGRGTRRWQDVAPLTHRSFSSAATNGWPKDSPMTLHSMASMMISVSDNSATDSLLFTLGREAVEERLAMIGHSAPDKTLPFLSTVEAFALKANSDVRNRFLNINEAAQRDLLTNDAASLTLDKIDNEALSKGPASIDSVEWFASPADLMKLLNHIRETKNDTMMAIMGINAGLPKATAEKWRYVGYKGGSEPGVISMSYLLQSNDGGWYVATGSWNDETAAVDDAKFANLMNMLVTVIGK
jgi:beta-lactamase class A